MPSFGPISSAPVSGQSAGGAAATAAPLGVTATASVGTVTASGGAAGSAIALPGGVTAYARVGQATVTGGQASGTIPLNYQFHMNSQRIRLYDSTAGNFSPKRAAEVEIFGVDFADDLAVGETIMSASWAVAVVDGVDPAAAAMVQGSNTIAGSVVLQRLGGGVPTVTYAPVCTAQTSLGQTLTLPEYGDGTLAVTP